MVVVVLRISFIPNADCSNPQTNSKIPTSPNSQAALAE